MYTPFLIVVTLACSAAVSGRLAGLFFKSLRRADPLRHDVRADLSRQKDRAIGGRVFQGVNFAIVERGKRRSAFPVCVAPRPIAAIGRDFFRSM